MFNIIPQPNNVMYNKDKIGFSLKSDTVISSLDVAEDFVMFAKKAFNITVAYTDKDDANIQLIIDDSIQCPEGYTLVCCDNKATINAKTNAGLLYGLQTLKQLLIQSDCNVPYTKIVDSPRFEYRGYMLDCGRYFYPIEDIKRIVDLMVLHKLNVLHWHINEDQGWRVEIKKYPLLTEKGSKRTHTNFNHKPHSGFYTQQQVKEIVEYCHKRQVKVIPEFDIPGHCVAAIACYPELSCLSRKIDVATHWGVKHDILCAGKESTYEFVFNVIDELVELFPDKIIHIGGDEAVKMRWKNCPHCQKAIKDNKLNDEDELQMLFMTRVNDYLKTKGYSSIMWNYDTQGSTEKLSPQIIWNMCGNTEKDIIAVKKELSRGRKIINTNCYPYYFDFPYGWNTLQMMCDNDGALTENDSETWGIEAQMWTEYVPNMKRLEFLTFPRLGAMAENAWANKGYPNFETFKKKADDYLKLLNIYNVNYAPMSKACPNTLYKHASSLWFNRRVLHWEGLHNLIDDKKAEKEAKELKEKLKSK